MTATIPKQHLTASHLVDVVTQIIVRTEYQLGILRQLVDHLLGIAAGDDDICQCLHRCRRVHIRNNLIAGMLVLEFLQILCLARVS